MKSKHLYQKQFSSLQFWLFNKRCSALASPHGLQKVCVLLEAFDTNKMITPQNSPVKYDGTLHFKTENTNPLRHVVDTLPIKIHSSYNYKDITITKTMMVRHNGQFCYNSVKWLLTNCWKLAGLGANNRSSKNKNFFMLVWYESHKVMSEIKVTGCFQSKQHFVKLIFWKRMTVILP